MFRTPIFSSQLAVGSSQEDQRTSAPSPRPTANGQLPTRQEGFTLAALLVILTIIMIIVAFTVPDQWSLVMGRERDRQTIFLMKQYARAIRAWTRKNGGPPGSLDQILEARRPRVIRGTGKWACPLTGKEDDWILVPPNAIEGFVGGSGRHGQGGSPGWQQSDQNGRTPGRTTRLNKDASPKEYVGQFVAVRPNASGPSFITFNGADDYSEWVYTVQDLENEIAMRAAALAAK